MNFLSVLYARAGITVDGVTTLNNTATGLTPATNDNSTKLATTGYVKNQNYYPYPTGTTAQYVRGDGSLATFTQTGGGGSSVSYYLNGSVSQGTIGGNTYYEMSKTAIIGTNTDFSINANGYVAQFVTDAGDPALLNIPGGNWNFEMFFSASSGGGSPSFYVELYKYDGTTLTLIASGSAVPESITGGTATDLYVTALAVPTTTLTLTDRLAIRVYVTHSGRTITLHTQNGHLCQVITTFTTGLTALNGLTAQVQNFAVGAGGSDFNISSVVDTHTFNLPTASATKRGALSSIDWSAFDAKVDFGDLSATAPLNYNGSGLFTIAQSSGSTNGYLSSTDWTTFNAKIGGSGTANYVAKFTSGSVVGNSSIVDDGAGNVYVYSRLFQSNGTNQMIFGQWDGVNNRIEGSSGLPMYMVTYGSALKFGVGGDEKAQINSSGNLLIGTTTDAGFKLDVLGRLKAQGDDYHILSAAESGAQLRLERTGSGAGLMYIGADSSGFKVFDSSFNTRFFVGNTGNVGIGTVNPTYKFEVSDGTRTAIINPNATLDGIFLGVKQAKPLIFGTSDTERMRITSGGNVLIGTTTDNGYKLEVNGEVSVNGDIRIKGNNQIYFDTTGDVNSNYVGVTNDYWLTLYCGRGNNARIDLTAGNGILFSEQGTERMRIAAGGNVLIGTTTNAGFKLDVNGNVSFESGKIYTVNNANGNSLDIYNHAGTGANAWRHIYGGSGTGYGVGVGGYGIYYNGNSGYNQINFPNGDVYFGYNVGIGTNSPSNKLVVTSDASPTNENTYAIAAASASDPAYKTIIGYDYTNDIGLIAAVRTGIGWRNLSIPQGNLLIGTITNAGYKLYVNGDAYLGAAYFSGTYSTFNSSYFTVNSSESVIGNNTSDIVGIAGNTMYFPGNSLVGIGTTNPLAKLHIVGEIRNSFGSGVGGSNYFNIIDGVSNGFRTTITTGNAITYTFHNGANSIVLNIVESGAATFASSVTATNFIVPGGTSAQFLKADGSLDSNVYLTSTSSTFSYTSSVTLTTSFQNTGVSSANLGTGAYLVTCYVNDYAVGGQYSCTYAGIMYFDAGGTNSSNANEIVLHHSGHADEGRYIYLRTLSTYNSDGKTYLQISGNGTNSGASNYQFTFKKLL